MLDYSLTPQASCEWGVNENRCIYLVQQKRKLEGREKQNKRMGLRKGN